MDVLPEIDSRFDVLAKLGEGGMGQVYKVRHRDLDEIQIVKTLQAHLSSNEALKNRFINEARRGMRLRHPHIAGVHDFQICADGTGYIVMEYVHGHNLRDLLATRGPLPLKMVGAIAVQTLDALGYLHSEKFVHRDISPDNLMLETAGGQPFVKLIDLGISKSLESGQTMTGTGQFLGKLQYASPEQFGGQIDGRSDLYSLGVTLYKLLTNEDPFVGENVQLITAHLFHAPRRFEEAAPDVQIPDAVQQVVYRALEKDPNNRYADADEFCAAVEEAFDIHDARPVRATRPARTETDRVPSTTLVDKTVVSLAPPTLVPAAPTVVERRPRRLMLGLTAGLLAVAVLAVAGFVVWQQRQAAALARYGTFQAVVIGESKYLKYPELPTAVDDSLAVAQLLEDKYGYKVTRLNNQSGTEIIAAIKAVKADNLLVFYAGHGELKNDKGYWLPVDADLEMTNWISPAMIRDVLLDHPARRTLLIADSCYSGSLTRGALAPPDKNDRIDKRSRMVISSGGTAPVIDSADGHHSIFTRALLEVLGDPARRVVDVEGVFAAIRAKVVDSARRAGREQKPELAVMAEVGDEGGSFYFVKR
jgi:tRNA A-37 threonylcarbamoyl transferase component Bud32/uncharacterized caspase-like protein